MTTREIIREIQNASTGRLMRDTSYSAFKVVVVLGATRDGRKLRVCPWSANQGRWSGPQNRDPALFVPVDLDAIGARQRLVVLHAMNNIQGCGREVNWKGGAHCLGLDPWLNKSSPKPVPPACITKLATEAVGKPNPKLGKMNAALSNFMFGRKR